LSGSNSFEMRLGRKRIEFRRLDVLVIRIIDKMKDVVAPLQAPDVLKQAIDKYLQE